MSFCQTQGVTKLFAEAGGSSAKCNAQEKASHYLLCPPNISIYKDGCKSSMLSGSLLDGITHHNVRFCN